ncbi:MAG: HAD family phosphatase [Muribaculaceae bacterium]|nr:HAD family phosphatase [Muribaculaceae bacterium]
MANHITAALFDLDGVLTDTEGTYTEIWAGIERHFPTGLDNFAHRIKGTTLPNILNTYFPAPDVQAEVMKMLYEKEEAMEYPLFKGVTEFLEALRDAGVPCAIVTSSGSKKMDRLFAGHPGFRDFFGCVLTDADVERSKPDPEGYIKAAARLGADISGAIVFEDSFNGLRAGRASGARVVALATTNPASSLGELADVVIDSLEGLTPDELLSRLEGRCAI